MDGEEGRPGISHRAVALAARASGCADRASVWARNLSRRSNAAVRRGVDAVFRRRIAVQAVEGRTPRSGTCASFLRVVCVGITLGLTTLTLPSPTSGGVPDAEVLPPGVSVRQAPAPAAPVIATLPAGAQVEVLFTQRGPSGSWAQVILPSGETGFIPDASLRRLTAPPQWRSVGGGSQSSRTAGRTGGNALAVPLRRIGGVLLVGSRINGQVATNFIVDTGASVVTISHALADRLGLEYAHNPKQRLITPSGIMLSPRVVLDTVHVPDETGAGVGSVEAVVATLPATPPDIGGLLGQSFLRHFHVTFDGERAIMHLQSIGAGGATHP